MLFINLLFAIFGCAYSGYLFETFSELFPILEREFKDLKGLNMLEFGNQECHDKATYEYPPFFTRGYISIHNLCTKYFYEYLGINHTSVDINGKDSSIILDCRTDLSTILGGQYDIVTNIGFAEHVGEGDKEENLMKNQYTMWKNMHDAGKRGTVYFHELPANSPAHGVVNYDPEFFIELGKRCGYHILLEPKIANHLVWHDEVTRPTDYFWSYKRVTDDQFISYDDFLTLPGIKSIFHTYGNTRSIYFTLTDIEELKNNVWLFDVDTSGKPDFEAALDLCREVIAKNEAAGTVLLDKNNEEYCQREMYAALVRARRDSHISM